MIQIQRQSYPHRFCQRVEEINYKREQTSESKRRKYAPTAATPLLPSEVLRLQAYIVDHLRCPIWDYQNYTLLLGAITLASRFDGLFSDLKHDDFNNLT